MMRVRDEESSVESQDYAALLTVMLPESTLATLAKIDADLSRAIVKAAKAATPDGEGGIDLPQLVEVAPGTSVIVVGPTPCLNDIDWLRLIEIAPGRFLLTLPSGMPIDSVEIALLDLLERIDTADPSEVESLRRLRDLVATLRRRNELSKAELLISGTAAL